MSDEYRTGITKWFNQDRGYGFLKMPDDGLDVFVHANQLRKSGIDRILKDGEKVRFKTQKGEKGPFAVDISLVPDDVQPSTGDDSSS